MPQEPKSSASHTFPNVCRHVRLNGGLCAIHNPGMRHADIVTGLGVPVLGCVEVPQFRALYHRLELLGFHVVGVEFIQSEDELNGAHPPEWLAFSSGRGWRVNDAITDWRERSFAAHRQGDASFVDLAARIAFGLAAAEERLRQTAVAYSSQLRGRQLLGALKHREIFDDLHGVKVTLAIHAAFYDFGAVRDALAEFLAGYVFKLSPGDRSWDMATLVKKLREKTIDDPVAVELLQITNSKSSTPGWLSTMSEYRNLFMHVAPVQFARSTSFAIQETRAYGPLGLFPVLYHPLPNDPAGLKSGRTKRPLRHSRGQSPTDEWLLPNRTHEPDALDYLSDSLMKLAELALSVATRAPYDRMAISLSEADIVGGVRIHRDGTPRETDGVPTDGD